MFSAYLSLSMSFTMAFGSYLSEIVISRGWLSRTNTRKTFAAVGKQIVCESPSMSPLFHNQLLLHLSGMYGMMICIVLVPWLGIHASNILIVLVIGSFLNGFQSGGAVIVPAEMSQHFGTTIYACINMLATSSGIIAPLVIGLMLDGIPEGADLKQRWNLVFYMTAAVLFSGTTLFMIFGSSERQDFDKMETPSKKSTSGQVASKSQKW